MILYLNQKFSLMRYQKITFLACVFMLISAAMYAQPDADRVSKFKDQQILDDLIVDGSACVGQDCVNGESFGFDTIRIKENNLRIKAQDTSNSASFPTQDWQLTFNDSSNGGQNRFSVETVSPQSAQIFTIESSNVNHALYVDDGGRIGFGTNAPVVELHIKEGDSPTVRLEQDGSNGWTPQTWDLAGNETNFFIRDVTNGSALPFRIRPGAPTSALEIEASGEINFLDGSAPKFKFRETGELEIDSGNTGSDIPLNVNDVFTFLGDGQGRWGSAGVDGLFSWGGVVGGQQNAIVGGFTGKDLLLYSNNGARALLEQDGSFILDPALGVGSSSAFQFAVQSGGGSTSSHMNAGDMDFTVTSSRSLKKNIKTYEVPDILDRIANVPVTTYNWKDSANKSKGDVLGMIAEEFYTVFERGTDKEIRGQDVTMALWLGEQALIKENQELRAELIEKEQRLQALEDQMADILDRLDDINIDEVTLPNNKAQGYIDQNIPNPFDAETQISYFIPQNATSASIVISTVNGQFIKEVSISDTGNGILKLNASDIPTGTYTYSLMVDGTVIATNKMILAK